MKNLYVYYIRRPTNRMSNSNRNKTQDLSSNPNSLNSINQLNQEAPNNLSNQVNMSANNISPNNLDVAGNQTGYNNKNQNSFNSVSSNDILANNLSPNNKSNNLAANNRANNKGNNLAANNQANNKGRANNNKFNSNKANNNKFNSNKANNKNPNNLNNLEFGENEPLENNLELANENEFNKADRNNLNKALEDSDLTNEEINEIEAELERQNVERNNKAKAAVSGMFTSAANKVGEYTESVTGNNTLMLVLKIILVAILLIVLINIIKYFYLRWESSYNGSPMLVDGTKNAKQAMVISQDPQHTNYVPIRRSVDKEGIEFSYAFWFLMSDFSYKQGEWKHVFHKGNSSSYPNRAPGVWIHPNANIIRVYMNTMKSILEYVDIDNIPVRKWVHIVVVMKNRHLQVYVNGFLKIRKELPSLPRQNYGNVWVNMYGGYEGYLSKLQYYDRAIGGQDIDQLVTQGPGSGNCIDTKEKPPYLEDSWWTN